MARNSRPLASAAVCDAAGVLLGWQVHAADTEAITITGQITLAPDVAGQIGASDRLVIKMYHPDEGIEKDLKYWILDRFAFPQDFRIAPTVNMAGKTRWEDYVIEVYTDRDRDVLNLIDGEIWATTGAAVALGTRGLELVMDHPPAR